MSHQNGKSSFRPVSLAEVPGRSTSGPAALLREFLASGAEAAEVERLGGYDLGSAAGCRVAYLALAVNCRRYSLPVKVAQRRGRLFLIRLEPAP